MANTSRERERVWSGELMDWKILVEVSNYSIAKQIGFNRKTWLTIKEGIEQFYLLIALQAHK